MISFQLDPVTEQRLRQLAASQGQDMAALAKRVLEEFLEFQSLQPDTEEEWAEASVALTPEVLPRESWPEGKADGSR